MDLGGFPHKCQLAANGLSISHERAGEAAAPDLRVTSLPRVFSALLRTHNSLMIFLRLFLWHFCFIRQQRGAIADRGESREGLSCREREFAGDFAPPPDGLFSFALFSRERLDRKHLLFAPRVPHSCRRFRGKKTGGTELRLKQAVNAASKCQPL